MYKFKRIISIFLLSILVFNISGIKVEAKELGVISVEGKSTIKLKPNRAELIISSMAEAATPGEANRKNNLKLKKIYKELAKENLAKEDIETIEVSVRPIIDYSKEVAVNKGYKSTNQISINIRDLESLGRIIDLCLDGGADRIDYIKYGHSDEAKIYEQALKQAFKQARSKADAIADAASLEIKGIRMIEEDSSYAPYDYKEEIIMESESIMDMDQSASNINIRDIEVVGSLKLEFIY